MYDFIDGDFFESLADFSYGDMYSPNFSNPDYNSLKLIFEKYDVPIIFIETHRLGLLFNELRNFHNRDVKIICHNSDATFGKELYDNVPNNVKGLWCQNYNYIETDVIKSLPIGLERVRWFPEQKKQEVLYEMMHTDVERTELVYMNFNPSTNPIRQKIFNDLKDKDFITKEMIGNGGNYRNYLMNLKKHKYVISPPGNGIDCHRNWEALYLGCIPIVLDSHFINNILENSCLRLSDFSTLEKNKIPTCGNLDISKLYKQYWKKLIYEEKN